jgi:hypothetical protein
MSLKGESLKESHNNSKSNNSIKKSKFQPDSSLISPEQASNYNGKLVKVSTNIHHVIRYKNKVILYIHDFPMAKFQPVVIIKPINTTKPLMTITLTKGGLERFEKFETSIVVAVGILNLRNGLPNLNVRDARNIEVHVVVE